MSLSGWLHKRNYDGPPRAERRPAPGLAAFYRSGLKLKQNAIKDLSSTGVFLYTTERWLPGEQVSLTMQKDGPPEKNLERRAVLQARAVRWEHDGVALAFSLPRAIDFNMWESLTTNSTMEPDPEDVVRELRMLETLAFLSRICPTGTTQLSQLMRKRLSSVRAANAVEIAVKAERMLAAAPDGDRLLAPPHLVERILEDGSWADDLKVRQFWVGLLATTCTRDGIDESNSVLIHPLSQMTAIHARLFTAACTRATKVLRETGSISCEPLVCEMEEIIHIAGMRDIAHVGRDIDHLSELGLTEKRFKALALLSIDEAGITPTSFGLEMYARCNGHRGRVRDFYDLVSAGESCRGASIQQQVSEPQTT
jgi:hypothetical protein